jgi:adenine/guanine phosphoribosyltransferase-like PRPP-binding protein
LDDFSQLLGSTVDVPCLFIRKPESKDDENFEEYNEVEKLINKKE